MAWLNTSGSGGVYPLSFRNQADSAWVIVIPDVATAGGGLLKLAGGVLAGVLNLGGFRIANMGAATTAGDAVNNTQVNARILSSAIFIGTQSATNSVYIFFTDAVSTDIVDVEIASELGVAADGANKWTFQVTDITGALNLLSAAKDTSAAAITADVLYALGVNQNNTALAAAKVIKLTMTKTGAPNALTEVLVQVKYRVATP